MDDADRRNLSTEVLEEGDDVRELARCRDADDGVMWTDVSVVGTNRPNFIGVACGNGSRVAVDDAEVGHGKVPPHGERGSTVLENAVVRPLDAQQPLGDGSGHAPSRSV